MMIRFASLIIALAGLLAACASANPTPPNIVLIYAEDISPELGCYGHPAVWTPVIDRLAQHGTRYTHVFCTGPSCTPSRNAMITGVYQTRTGLQDQRRGGVTLPEGVEPITTPLRRAGYYCAVGCGYNAKTDLNFVDSPVFDGDDWSQREPNQPFFAQITLGITHRHPGVGWTKIRAASQSPVDPARVELPPYFPDTAECRLDWAGYLDSIEAMDSQVGEILSRIEEEGLSDNTVVLFMGDNGRCHLRGKCWLYEGGLHVPLVIRFLDPDTQGVVNKELHSTLDVSATILALAGADVPDVFDGRPLVGPDARPREMVFAARDLIDEVRDPIRCVRTDRYKYIRNYRPENGYAECQYVQDNRPMLPVIRRLATTGQLTVAQQLVIVARKPDEEFYDLEGDPHELTNLASDPRYTDLISELRAELYSWLAETNDTGLQVFSEESAAASAP